MEHQNLSLVTEHELSEIRHFIEQRSGILFDESRTRFLASRIGEYLAEKRVPRGAELLRMIRSSNLEYDNLLERVLTQETSFFRYPAVFRALRERVLPDLQVKKRWQDPRTLRIWSAGCSTGEEPYSIAMATLEALELAPSWNIEILATDISRSVLRTAELGTYSARELEALSAHQIDAYFAKAGKAEYQVKAKLKSMITFAPMNLAQMVYMGRFDCIFCMNVLIYFSDDLRAELIRRFHDFLEPQGYLFLGHAESVAKAKVDLEPIVIGDSLMYRKLAPASRVALQESV